MFVCLCVCLSWGQRFAYVFKVSMRNIMFKSVQRQLYLCTYIPNKRTIYIRGVFTCRSELQGLFYYYYLRKSIFLIYL